MEAIWTNRIPTNAKVGLLWHCHAEQNNFLVGKDEDSLFRAWRVVLTEYEDARPVRFFRIDSNQTPPELQEYLDRETHRLNIKEFRAWVINLVHEQIKLSEYLMKKIDTLEEPPPPFKLCPKYEPPDAEWADSESRYHDFCKNCGIDPSVNTADLVVLDGVTWEELYEHGKDFWARSGRRAPP